MSWLLPTPREVLPVLRRLAGQVKDKHRPGYWREYHARNAQRRRSYLARWQRENRPSRARAAA